MSENSEHPNQQDRCFQHITVIFHTYLFIRVHDRTLLILMLLLTHPIMPIYNINTQTIFVVLFTSGSLLTWGKSLDASSRISPRYLSTTYSQLTVSPFFYRHLFMTDYAFFSGVGQVGEGDGLAVGEPYHLPTLQQFHIPSITPVELSSLTSIKAWGEKQKIHHNIAFLLILTEEEATGDRRYGLSTMWVNPCQARVHSMEEAVRELPNWVSSGPNWPYTLVQLHEDTCHVPLPKEGHLGILPQGGAEMTACRRINQLEVCQLLISSLQVIYPVGLNRCEEPIIPPLPKSLANSISLTGGESVYLEIDIPQSLAEEPDWKALPIGKHSTIIIASPHKTTPKIRRRGQHDHGSKESPISSDVEHVWSWVRDLDPKKTKPCGHTYTSTPQAAGTLQTSGYLIPDECPE